MPPSYVDEPKGEAPEGRQTVTGIVLSTKLQSSTAYGAVLKMLVKLPNNSRVWVSAPKDRTVKKGQTITFTATFERSKLDESFAFGNRPVFLLSPPEGTPLTVRLDAPVPAPLSASIADIDAAKPVRTPREPREAPAPSILAELLLELEN